MSVVAKFKVISKSPTNTTALEYRIAMQPVYDSDPNSENGKFFAATPGGSISLSVVNPAAAGQFVEGREYLVTFTRVG